MCWNCTQSLVARPQGRQCWGCVGSWESSRATQGAEGTQPLHPYVGMRHVSKFSGGGQRGEQQDHLTAIRVATLKKKPKISSAGEDVEEQGPVRGW